MEQAWGQLFELGAQTVRGFSPIAHATRRSFKLAVRELYLSACFGKLFFELGDIHTKFCCCVVIIRHYFSPHLKPIVTRGSAYHVRAGVDLRFLLTVSDLHLPHVRIQPDHDVIAFVFEL